MNKLGFVVAVVLAAGCGDNHGGQPDAPKADASRDAGPDKVARGQYIMNVLGACTFCHTPLLPNGMRDPDKLFAGVDCFADINSPTFQDNGDGVGCISTRNLTNDATGLMNATDTQIKNAFRNGMRTDGKKIVPLMPFWVFHNMTDDDADAVVAYLRTVPGRNHQVKANEQPFQDYNDGITTAIPPLFNADIVPLTDAEIPMPKSGTSNAAALRGRYLATKAGLCIDCHSTATSFLEIDKTKIFGGGRVFNQEQLGLNNPAFPPAIAARNITTDATGLGGWTKQQIKDAIGKGKDRDGNQVCAATHGGLVSGYAALEPGDLDDIVEYVADLPAVMNDAGLANCGIPPIGTGPEMDTQCANSTDDDGDGVPNDGCYVQCNNCAGPPVP
jgi:mono/diheme cytochrome c family protein